MPLFELLRGFAAATGAKVILGEWTLARLGSRGLDAAAARYYYEETSRGAFLGRCVWNFDGPGAWRAAAPAHPATHTTLIAWPQPSPPFLPESVMVHGAMHRGAIQPNNASEHEFWPAVNRNVPSAIVESVHLDGALW